MLEALEKRRKSAQANARYISRLIDVTIRSDNAETLKQADFYKRVEGLIEAGYIRKDHQTLKKDLKTKEFFLTRYKKNFFYLTYKDSGNLKIYKTHALDDKKNEGATNEFTAFKRDFKEKHGVSFQKAFGSTDISWKSFVPGLFHADNPDFLNKKTKNVGKVDFSSHFTACALGRLPDASTALRVKGKVEPTEDYPFAFYPQSHHIAEFGVFDSRNWRERYKAVESLWKDGVDYEAEDKETILMKAADYELDEQLLQLYEAKRKCSKGSPEYKHAKLVMLKMVGKFEQNDPRAYERNPYCHLAAIIKGRAIQRMIDVIDRIGEENVIQIIVDGMIYHNPQGVKLGSDAESLGSLKQEFLKAKAQIRFHNQYMLEENGIIEKCHAGLDTNIDSDDIKDWKSSGATTFRAKLAELSDIEYLK